MVRQRSKDLMQADREWPGSYKALRKIVERHGKNNAFGDGDFWLPDDDWGESIVALVQPVDGVAGDDALISQAHERPTVYIAVHQHRTMEYEPYFREIERIFREYDGRPHWGKLHFRTAEDLAPSFPRWADFQKVRDELDPNRNFSNAYVTEVLGA